MGLRFIHAADLHLGYEQYGVVERSNDFYRAFVWLCDQALDQRVDFVLLAGDLFNKPAIDAHTLLQATRQLQRLRDANIPTLAVKGNHEGAHTQDRFGWLDYLDRLGFLRVLSIAYTDGDLTLSAGGPHGQLCSHVDLPSGVRVVGLQYVGASSARVVADLAAALPAIPGPAPAYCVLMLHAGLEGVLPNYSGGLTHAQLAPLKPYVNYLAMGHIHKPFAHDDWIYNPGSLETVSIQELAWSDRGCLLVELDDRDPVGHRVTRLVSPRRPFRQIDLEVDEHTTPDSLYGALERRLSGERPAELLADRPVAVLRLRGVLPFSNLDLETARLENIVRQALNPLHYVFHNEYAEMGPLDDSGDRGFSSAELERLVLAQLVEREVRYKGQGERWADLVIHVKQMALGRSDPSRIIDELRAFLREQSSQEAPC